ELAAGNPRAAAVTRLSLGELSQARGDTTAARRELAQAAADLERLGDPVATAAALGQRAGLEAAAGLPAAAESLYRAALERLRGRTAPDVSWHLHSGLGLARRAQGDAEEAARELRLAIAEVERPSRSLALAERRSAFLADKWEVYAQLALTERARSRPGAAFEASERLRAREMLELLARGRVAAPADTAADLVAREQDLRRHIAELTRELEDVTAGDDAVRGSSGRPAPQAGREALDRAQEAYTDLLLEIGERAPQHASLVSREAPRWQEVGRRLAPEQAFVEYLVSDSGSLAFVVTRDTAAVVDLGAGRRDLARLVAFARGTLEPRRARVGAKARCAAGVASRGRRGRRARRSGRARADRRRSDRGRVPPRGAAAAHRAPRDLRRAQQAQPAVLVRRARTGRRTGRAARGARGIRPAPRGRSRRPLGVRDRGRVGGARRRSGRRRLGRPRARVPARRCGARRG